MIEQLLQAMYDVITNDDDLSRMALADALEEYGLNEQATNLRNKTQKLADCLTYKVATQKGDKYHVFIHMKELVNMLVRRAASNNNKRCTRLDGMLSAQAHITFINTRATRERRIKDQIPMSELGEVEHTNRG